MPSPTTHTLLLQLRQILDEKCEPAEAARRHQQRPGRGTSGGGGGAKRGGSEPYPGHESVASAGGRGAIAELELTQHAMAELFTSLATASPIVVYRRVHRPRDLLRSRLASYLESVFGANSSSVKAKILDPPSVLLHTFTSAVNCLQVRVGVRVRSGHSPPLAPSRELVSMATGLSPPAPPTPRPALLPPPPPPHPQLAASHVDLDVAQLVRTTLIAQARARTARGDGGPAGGAEGAGAGEGGGSVGPAGPGGVAAPATVRRVAKIHDP